jgi:hypothetical protein
VDMSGFSKCGVLIAYFLDTKMFQKNGIV